MESSDRASPGANDIDITGLAATLSERLQHESLHRALTDAERSSLLSVADAIRHVTDRVRQEVRQAAESRAVKTPPELAREWGVSPDKVLHWIRTGELRATNVAISQSGRPRYRIDPEAIAAFQARRTPQSPPPVVRRSRRPTSDVIEFF